MELTGLSLSLKAHVRLLRIRGKGHRSNQSRLSPSRSYPRRLISRFKTNGGKYSSYNRGKEGKVLLTEPG